MDPIKTAPQQESKLHFLDYWRIIRIRKTVILAVFLLVVITATLVTFILPEQYSSTARIRVERDVTDITPISDRPFVGGSYDPYFIQTEFEVIQSEVVMGQVIKSLDLRNVWGKKYGNGEPLKTDVAMAILKGRMDLRPVRNTSLIEIRVYSEDPNEAARLANAIAETYREHRLNQRKDLTESGIKALLDRYADQQNKIHQAQTNVDSLRVQLKISEEDAMADAPTPMLEADTVRRLQGESVTLETEQVRIETLVDRLKQLTPAELRETIQTASGADPELGNLITEFNTAQERLIALEKDYATNHPIYLNAQKIAQDLDTRINLRVAGMLRGMEARVEQESNAVVTLQAKLEAARSNDLVHASQSRPYYEAKQEMDQQARFGSLLSMKIAAEETDVQLPKETMVEIVDSATPGAKPVKPNKMLSIILGVVIGLVVGVGLAFFIEYLDTSVKTIDDVERTLQAPVLGVIPQNVGLMIEEGIESPHAEAYRVLRTNILFSRKDDKLNTIAIVSAGAGEGKSTTVFNLATVFAQNGHRCVIVDSDLRRPTLHKMLHVTNSLGLTNYLLKQNTLEEVIQTTKVPSLDFLASGKLPSSSLGILSSTQMRQLVTDLKARYDFVFLDSPPIMGVSDASILASEVDMTLQVIQYRRYPQPMNIRAKQMIEKVGGNLVGIVLNNINMSQDENYYYYSGYYHDYYYRSDNEPEGGAKPGAGNGAADKSKVDIKPKY